MSEKKIADPSSFIKWLGDMLTLISNYGFWKIIQAILIICLSIAIFTIAIHPERVIEKAIEISEKRELANREFRKQNDPLIRNDLRQSVYELNAIRASVLEFHNGKENPSGLGFLYVDMTYDQHKDGYTSITSNYQDVNLSWLNLPTVLYENGFWYGPISELKKIDSKLGCMMESHGTRWVSFLLLTGSEDLGILVLSYAEEPQNIQYVGREIRKLGIKVASKLDYGNR